MARRGIMATVAFAATAAALFLVQTALWVMLFCPWADPLAFGLLFTLATFPLSGAVAAFGGTLASRRVYRADRSAVNHE